MERHSSWFLMPVSVVVSLVVSLVVLAGCGSKDVPTASIAAPPESVILGTWDGHLELTDPGDRNLVVPPEVARSRKIAQSSEFRFEYQDNGVFRMSVRSEIPDEGPLSNEVEGTWEIIQETGKDIQLRVKYESGKKESLHLIIIDENTIENSSPDELKGFTLKMKRAGK